MEPTQQHPAYVKYKAMLPEQPGVYRYYDHAMQLLYIGKAKNLKKRVSSYFTKEHDLMRLRKMVSQIDTIEMTIVDTEKDALLLENSLIKKHQPKYNIELKDDKTYPFVCITNEPFPKVYITRNKYDPKATYYGPFYSVDRLRSMLDFLKPTFQYRTCNLALFDKNIEQNKFKVCLEYHIGNCQGACVGKQSSEDYRNKINQLGMLFKGRFKNVIEPIEADIQAHAERMEYEKAAALKHQVDSIKMFQSRNSIVSQDVDQVDVFAFDQHETHFFINYLSVSEGSIIHTKMLQIIKQMDETDNDIFAFAVAELRQSVASHCTEIITNTEVDYPDASIKVWQPKHGDKRKLVELAIKNVKYNKQQYLQNQSARNAHSSMHEVLEIIKKDFRLSELPTHIECFDNSNFQGSFPVSAMVVFRNAKPSKRDYRIYNVKTVEGPNDFATMEEVVFRRYRRLMEEGKPLPQLVIVDGGKGQLSSAMKSIEALGLRGKMTIVGIAKQLEEIFFPDDSIPLYIDKRSPSLKIVQHLRNEAHRFGITNHRNRRSKSFTKTELSQIDGIGDATAQTLLKHFKSVKKISIATLEEITQQIGPSKAGIVFASFNASDEPTQEE